MLVAFLLALISFGSRLEAKPKYRERVKPKPRVQKIKEKKKKRYQRRKSRKPNYQFKLRKNRGFIQPEVYKKQQRERRERKLREKKQKKAIPNPRQKPFNNNKNKKKKQMNKKKITIHKKGNKKLICDKLCQHRSRHIRRLLRLGHDVTDSYDLRLRTPSNKRNTIKKRGQ